MTDNSFLSNDSARDSSLLRKVHIITSTREYRGWCRVKMIQNGAVFLQFSMIFSPHFTSILVYAITQNWAVTGVKCQFTTFDCETSLV